MTEAPMVPDHLYGLLVAVGYTAYAILTFRRIRPALERNEPGARLREYRSTLVAEWVLCGVALGLWTWAERSWETLGFGFPLDWRHGVAGAVGALVIVGLVLQAQAMAGTPGALESVRGQLGEFGAFLPHDRRELRTFVALSLTAGVCEELVYRAWLLWYLDALAGPVVAVIGSSVIFGLGHAGYGPSTGVRAGALGLFLAGLYLLGGALWVPMVVHAAFDVSAGVAGWRVNR